MPKVPHDFSKEMIFYIIRCANLEKTDIYVGSTFNFTKRKNQHKSGCNNPKHTNYNLKIYIHIRENGGWNNFTMTMLDRKICVDMLEARKHEQSLIDKYKANLNTNKAFTNMTHQERGHQYYIDNADKVKERVKQYQIENADIVKEKKHQYYIDNSDIFKEKSKQYHIENFDKIKEKKQQYNIEHTDIIKEQQRQYNINNAVKISEIHKQWRIKNDTKLKEKITCECGVILCRELMTKKRHTQTKKHQAYLATKQSVVFSK